MNTKKLFQDIIADAYNKAHGKTYNEAYIPAHDDEDPSKQWLLTEFVGYRLSGKDYNIIRPILGDIQTRHDPLYKYDCSELVYLKPGKSFRKEVSELLDTQTGETVTHYNPALLTRYWNPAKVTLAQPRGNRLSPILVYSEDGVLEGFICPRLYRVSE